MKKRHADLKLRVEFEPNRFSSDWLAKVYEQLKPVDSRIIFDEGQTNEQGGTRTARKGGEQ